MSRRHDCGRRAAAICCGDYIETDAIGMNATSTVRRPQRAARGLLALMLALVSVVAHADSVLVFAAASLKPALDRIIATPEIAALGEVKASYAASSQLARQIEAGAPGSAVHFRRRGLDERAGPTAVIVAATRVDLLGNALVLVAPKDSTVQLDDRAEVRPGRRARRGRPSRARRAEQRAGRQIRQGGADVKLGVWERSAAHRLRRQRARGAATSSPAARRRSASSIAPMRYRNRPCASSRRSPPPRTRRSSIRRRCRRPRHAGRAQAARPLARAGVSRRSSGLWFRRAARNVILE